MIVNATGVVRPDATAIRPDPNLVLADGNLARPAPLSCDTARDVVLGAPDPVNTDAGVVRPASPVVCAAVSSVRVAATRVLMTPAK